MGPLSALRATAYQLDLPDDAWVRALCREARDVIDEGSGLFVYSYRVEGGRIELRNVAGAGSDADVWQALSTWGARHQRRVAAVYRDHQARAVLVSELARVHSPPLGDLRASLGDCGIGDLLTIIGQGPQSDGVILTAPRRRGRSLTTIERRTLSGLASELAAIVRLRHLRPPVTKEAGLSGRERRVAVLLSRGCSDKEIARELGVAMSTVSTFIRRIRGKLGCRGGAEIAHLASQDSGIAIRRRHALFERLTVAERAVAVELIAGASYEEIAMRQSKALRTIAAQAATIFRKSGVSGRRELAAATVGGAVGKMTME